MLKRGKFNAPTDVEGICVGHVTRPEAASGVTVILCPEGTVAGVDVRGAAPGTRETDLLEPGNLVQEVQAVVLSGGSVFGLCAADGVVRWLAERGLGFPVEKDRRVPIVPAAVLYDLGRGETFVPPIEPGWGREACEKAAGAEVAQGSVGAGTGAVAGGMKGGLGCASVVLDSGITVAALAAVNAFGPVVDPHTGRPWEIMLEVEGEFGEQGMRAVRVSPPEIGPPARNTTLGVVATDARLTKSQARKIAQAAHDGLARAIRPAHTLFDGDTIFCLATGGRPLPLADGFFQVPWAPAMIELGRAAADCMSRAIVSGILKAQSLGPYKAFRDLPDLGTGVSQ